MQDTGTWLSVRPLREHRCCRSCRSRWSRGPATLWAGRGGSHEPPLPPVLPAPPPAAALTAGPAAEQADAPLLTALRPQQLALVAVGGGVRAAHGRHHAGAGALPAHAGGSARVVGTGLAHRAKATQHSSARWGGTGRGGLSPQSSVHTRSRRCSAHGSFMELPSWPRTQARGCSQGLALPSQTLPTAGRPTSLAFPYDGSFSALWPLALIKMSGGFKETR